jgi:hypothetical protein
VSTSHEVLAFDGWTVMPLGLLEARSAAELAQLLTALCALSGRTKAEVAQEAGIARSQLYSLLGGRLARDSAQLRGILLACRLHPFQRDAVILQWRMITSGVFA